MLEMVESFVRTVAKPGPAGLVGVGVGAVLAGLFVWLGGLGFRKALVIVVGGAAGLLSAFAFIGRAPAHLILATAVGVVLAMLLEKVFLTLLASAIASVTTIVVFAAYCENADFTISTRYALGQLPPQAWIVAAGLGAGFIVAGFYMWRFVSAVACSALGTIFVFAGMILLLSYKGAAPLRHIEAKPLLYAGAFCVMIAFGAAVQLGFCGRPKKVKAVKKETKKQAPEPAPEPEKERVDWRMH